MIELLSFKNQKDEQFETDILHFAAKRYGAAKLRNWSVMIEHLNAQQWIDLFSVSRHSTMESDAAGWPNCDAYSLTWDLLTPSGWTHATRPLREQLVPRLELDKFDARIAKRAAQHDLATFIQDDLITWNGNAHNETDYYLQVLMHEVLHSAGDWTNQQLVVDYVSPEDDHETANTLAAFIKSIGGWDTLKTRYQLCPQKSPLPHFLSGL